jgi:host factor-I protein
MAVVLQEGLRGEIGGGRVSCLGGEVARGWVRHGEMEEGAWTTAGSGCKQQERVSPMSAEKTQNVQDVFLNHIRKNKVPVTIFLINGVKLQGVVSSFDNFSLLLRRDGHVQLVYKHAVSTVMPATVVRLYEPSSEEAATAE